MTPTEDPAVIAARLDKYDQKAATLVRQMKAEHEAFRREVSDAIAAFVDDHDNLRPKHWPAITRFIIINPVDPLVEALAEAFAEIFAIPDEAAKAALAVIAARGLEIREKK